MDVARFLESPVTMNAIPILAVVLLVFVPVAFLLVIWLQSPDR